MTSPTRLRASDADRERVAARIQEASTQGRLTLDETEQRLGDVYAAKYVDELDEFVSDLPAEPPPRAPRFPPPLRLHAALVVLLSALLIARWAVSGVPFFWPAMPMFWLGVSLVVHAGIRARRRVVQY
ncbi:DUF1707 domain-containing protein [Amycolatopsis sp. K13G38]|uniref:DUF1707 domain-containing protein n=1 Tax=Amycolatopsis acididurans TaxID=2724524 RepID=A0ABX1JHV5_9PSEU|nr:DUF1707 domain-containing protein [Amycolatopsis acididurans]NKQ58156.1 DUF1707 domain-containing protein [Amycolatopsis acididurans]